MASRLKFNLRFAPPSDVSALGNGGILVQDPNTHFRLTKSNGAHNRPKALRLSEAEHFVATSVASTPALCELPIHVPPSSFV
ncbi:hypothetical protein Taro_016999 [Colocasia esculenta]|uniref:Uncharacterized protein n=1 Tax=Colocasia esculenta TaxID=4460 RepID=A0A843UQ13_COLES|nr:hypothetical protein [Colocasia esculenta]